jgi:hypothetical protein
LQDFLTLKNKKRKKIVLKIKIFDNRYLKVNFFKTSLKINEMLQIQSPHQTE